MRRLLLCAALAVAIATPASAAMRIQTHCNYGSYEGSCTTTIGPAPEMPPLTWAERKAFEDQILKWEAYCKPTPKEGADGLVRMRYLHEGCDLGRSED